MQCGHRTALSGISVAQNPHSFVVGSAGGASSSRRRLFIPLITMNRAKAMMRKLTSELTKTP